MDSSSRTTVRLLLAADVEGRSVRLFASPRWLRLGVPDLPWHSADDLRAAMGMAGEMDEVFRRLVRRDWSDLVETVGTSDGITTIAPYAMGEGLIRALARHRTLFPPEVRKRVEAGFRGAHTKAIPLMVPHLRPLERMAFSLQAMGIG